MKYTVADDVAWSDGTAVDATDLLLAWGAFSGNLNTIAADKVKTDDATGLPKNTKGKVYFDTSSPGLALVEETPEISDDGKSLTLVYTKPFADWKIDMGGYMPAHVVGREGPGHQRPAGGQGRPGHGVNDKDAAALAKISEFWNTGFDYTSMPSDDSLNLSNGAYLMKDFKENQYMTLEANPDYKGEHKASIDQLTIRWNEDPMAQVQALQNGEIDMFAPQVTTDVVKAAEKISDAEIESGVEGTYEHVDLVFNNKGPFDAGELQRRQGQGPRGPPGVPARCSPPGGRRQAGQADQPRGSGPQLVPAHRGHPRLRRDRRAERLLGVRRGRPGQVDADPEGGWRQDPDRRAHDVRRGQRPTRERVPDLQARAQEGRLQPDRRQEPRLGQQARRRHLRRRVLRLAVDQHGRERRPGDFGTGGINNLIGYSNPKVDALFDELIVTADEAKQLELQTEIEKILYEDAVGITVFQFPGATISNKTRVTNVDPGHPGADDVLRLLGLEGSEQLIHGSALINR